MNLEQLWDAEHALLAAVSNAPDLASLSGIVTTVPANLESHVYLGFRKAVRDRYCQLTQQGTPNGAN
jgi:hypothetical protein